MQNLFKDYFYFSRGEKRGILILIAAVCIVFLAGYLISAWQRREYISPDDMAIQADAEQEYEEFIASLKEKEQHRERQYTTYKKQEENPPVILASFNPNTADSITFRRLGLPAWMAKNILHYRAKGGKFRKPEDFKKVYGITEEQYSVLLPYIHIPPEDTVHHIPQLYIAQNAPVENIKYAIGTILDLNRADKRHCSSDSWLSTAIRWILPNRTTKRYQPEYSAIASLVQHRPGKCPPHQPEPHQCRQIALPSLY